MDEKRLSFWTRLWATLICYLIFSIVYEGSAFYASTLSPVPSFVFTFEKQITFIPWMIIPYMTSGLLFTLVSFLCTSKKQLFQYVARVIILTLVSGLIYFIFPLKFSFPKPAVENSFFNYFFNFLKTWDSPFNQAPSLHVGYACLFWSIIKVRFSGLPKYLLGTWLILLVVSTLTVYQHHFIDVITAFILVQLVFIFTFIRSDRIEKRNQYVAQFYYLFALILVLIALLLNEFVSVFGLLLLWVGLILWVVGQQYAASNACFLKNKNGKISFWKKLFYFPYLFAYWFIWKFLRKSQNPILIEILPNLFIGPRLTDKEANGEKIGQQDIVYDLTVELEEGKLIRSVAIYHSFPMLDIGGTSLDKLEKLIEQIQLDYQQKSDQGRIIVHCTMGYSRSSLVGALLLKKILTLSVEDSIARIQMLNKNCILGRTSIDLLYKID